MKTLCDMEKMSEPIFFLLLSAMKLETKERHLVCNQINSPLTHHYRGRTKLLGNF